MNTLAGAKLHHMKKTTAPTATGCLLLLATLLSPSCSKIEELGSELKNGNADLKACVIREIDFQVDNPAPGISTRLSFTYDNRRNPLTVTPDQIGTGAPEYYFYYDKKGRLVTFAGLYNNGFFQSWDNYIYDDRDRIVGDSAYVLGEVGQLGGAAYKYFSVLTYDNWNRIIEEKITNSQLPFNPPLLRNYSYDGAGNLILPGAEYDNDVSILLTNKIWRFLNRNYSLNNSGKALTYNEHKLPTLFPGVPGDLVVFSSFPVQGSAIQYDCMGDLNQEEK